MNTHIVKCPLPPGGEAKCPIDNLAICRVINSQTFTECHEVSPCDLQEYGYGLEEWCFDTITQEPRAYGPLTPSEKQILYSGHYESLDGSMQATFSLPAPGSDGDRVDNHTDSTPHQEETQLMSEEQ